ncbi:MAG: VanW family protein [Thermoleophilia bacterium]
MVARLMDVMREGSWRVRFAGALGLLLLVAVLLVLGDSLLNFNRIHAGVSVSGYDVGRMTREEATSELTRLAQEAQENEILLTAEGGEWRVLPSALGTKIDVKASVQAAYQVSREQGLLRDLGRRFSLYFSGHDVDLMGTVRKASMDALIEEVAAVLDDPPVNAALKIENGEVHISEGREGRVVDREALRRDLKELLFSFHATELPVPMKVVQPDIKGTETAESVALAKTMISAPVELTHGENSWTLKGDRIATLVDFEVTGEGTQARLIPVISAEKAKDFLAAVAEAVDRPAKKATWETDGSKATIVPHEVGLEVDREATAEALTQAAQSTTDRVAEVQTKETLPERTTEQAREMGIEVAIGSFTTEFGGSENRRDNVQRAAELINGTLIAPGEEFDFNTVVGQRTADNGFKTAPVIINGKLEDSLGGGICQVSTTLFNAAFFAGLDITARTNHSLYISHYPTGRDATVSWGGPDLRFRNDTDGWILIKSASSRSSVTFVIYGRPTGRKVSYTTSDWYAITPPAEKKVKTDALLEGETKVVDEGQTGRKIKVTRTVTAGGEVIHQDTFVSNYPMKPKIIEVGTKPKPTTTTTTVPDGSPPDGEPTPTTATTAG